jgi:cell wall-associated NlpC family hydrolase
VATRPAYSASARITSRPRATFLAAAALSTALVAVATVVPAPATAEPRPTIEQVEAQLHEIEERAEAAAEERNGIRIELAETERKANKVESRIKSQEDTLAAVRTQLGVFAAAAYRTGGIDSTLQLMLSEDPAGFLEQTNSLNAVARGQQSAMRRAAAAAQQLDQSRRELAQTEDQQQKAQEKADAASQAIADREAEAQALLDSLQQEERDRLMAAQAARTAEAQRASRDAERSLPDPAPATQSSNTGGGGGGNGGGGGSYDGPAAGRAAKAVAYARAQVGKTYTWGGAGPNSFDCSGLTMRAWQAAGVSLPHQSGAQYAATRKVSYSDVQPGDLLFFHSPISHVGIYAGGGMMIHAQNRATGVLVTPMSSRMSSLVGVGRP